MTARRTALVAGALGITGRCLLERLERDPSWDLVALARRKPDFQTRARLVPADLLDPADSRDKIGGLTDVTHVFYCAYSPRPTRQGEVETNVAMLANMMDALEPAARNLQHVHLMLGNKWYGSSIGAFPTPTRENDQRPMGPNFYHAQQDWLVERRAGKAWTWSVLRPHGVWGFAVGGALNLMNAIACYAVISKHLGLPLSFPGKPGNFTAIYNMIDVDLLAEAMEWAATDSKAADQPFNMTNGDILRWSNVWPTLAAFFGMEVGPLRTMRLAEMMADKAPVWDEIVARHGLRPLTLSELANFAYLDFALGAEYDQMAHMGAARRAGWNRWQDTEKTMTRQLQRIRDMRVIP